MIEEQVKHGDEIMVQVGSTKYNARVEERLIGQYPSGRIGMFLVIEGHFPIEYHDFKMHYGTIIHSP